jgi:hypothetical protein
VLKREVDVRFDDVLLKALDDGLLVFGSQVRDVIYEILMKRSRVRRDELPRRLDAFCGFLKEVSGSGAKIIEVTVAKSLYDRLRLNFDQRDDWTLVEYVDHARKGVGA